jgi:hypothetical protein
MSAQHTPTPWEARGNEIWTDGARRLDNISAGTIKIAEAIEHNAERWTAEGNAAYITRACNAYTRLQTAAHGSDAGDIRKGSSSTFRLR